MGASPRNSYLNILSPNSRSPPCGPDINYVDVVVDTIRVASMDEMYVTYVDDEHADNHDHDDYKLN